MKKKVVILITGVLILSLFIISGYLLKKDNKNDESQKETVTYTDYYKTASIKGKDGWYYYFLTRKAIDSDIKDPDSDKTDTLNFYDSVNLKYDKLENYNILVFDSDTGEVINRIPTSPSYSVSEYSIDGVIERDELRTLTDFFDKKQFNREITLDDLKELELHNFFKEDIIKIYNKTINQKFTSTVGKFTVFSGEIRRDSKKEGYNWQVGMLQQSCVAQNILIDIDYGDGVYLSDLIKSNNASKRQKEIYSYLSQIENYVIENQDVDFNGVFDELKSNKDFKRLFALLGTLDDGWSN